MSCLPDIMPTSLAAAVAPRTGKIIENLLQSGILHFVFKLSQSSEIVVRNRVTKLQFTLKCDFFERGLVLNGFIAIVFFCFQIIKKIS